MATRYMTLAQFRKASNTESDLDAGELADIYEVLEEMSRVLDENARHPLYERREIRKYQPISVDNDGCVDGRKLVLDDFLIRSPLPSITMAGDSTPIQASEFQLLPLNGNYASVIELVNDDSSWLSSLYQYGSNILVEGLWGHPKNSWDGVGTLSADVGSGDTTIVFSVAPTLLEKYQTLKIGTEYMDIISVTGANVVVTRGVNGSTAAAHVASDIIYVFIPAPVIRRAMKRFTDWWLEQDKAPLVGVVTVGDASVPVNNSKIPPDLQDLIKTIRTASTFTKA